MLIYILAEKDKHSSFLGPFIRNKENEVLWIWLLWMYIQHFIFSVTCRCANEAIVFCYARLERLTMDKHSSFLGPIIRNEENKVLWIRPLDIKKRECRENVAFGKKPLRQCLSEKMTNVTPPSLSRKARPFHFADTFVFVTETSSLLIWRHDVQQNDTQQN